MYNTHLSIIKHDFRNLQWISEKFLQNLKKDWGSPPQSLWFSSDRSRHLRHACGKNAYS
jgi:hypothetical protein